MVGWVLGTDAALMTAATGAAAIGTGGGFVFRMAADGTLYFGYQSTTVYAEVATGYVQPLPTNAFAAANWVRMGFRAVWLDASAGTGRVDYFVNGVKKGSIYNKMCMTSTEAYCLTYELINSSTTADQVDMAVNYILTAISEPGVTVSL
jgi:hypothetical protein